MIGTIRKHSKVLWWIIIVAIIITFVYWGSSSSRSGGGAGRGDGSYGSMNGQVITPTLFEEAAREVRLNYFYSSNMRWPERGQTPQGFDLESKTYQRLLLVQKIKEMGIHVSDDAVAQAAEVRMRYVNRGNPVSVGDFEKKLLAPQRLTLEDFQRFVHNELAIQQLGTVIGAGGDLVTAQEVEALYRREFQEISAQVVFFRASNEISMATIPAEKLGEFYTNRMAAYRLPERMQIHYVSYPLSNYLAQAKLEMDKTTNLTEIVEAYYEQMGSNYFGEATTPTAAKEKIRADFLKRGMYNAAAKDAQKFDAALYEKDPYTPETFVTVAKAQGLTPQLTAPFSMEEPPAGLDVREDFVARAFGLSAEQPLTEPLAGENHVYVIAFQRQLPSENPSFESVRERVIHDYRFVEAATKAQQVAVTFHATATNELAAGKTFAAICAKAGLKPLTLAPFSPSTRTIPEIENMIEAQPFRRVAFGTPPGQVGQLLPSADGAAQLYVQARLPINESAMVTNLPVFARNVQQMRRGEIVEEWFRQEANKAFPSIPYFQQKQAQMSGAGPKK